MKPVLNVSCIVLATAAVVGCGGGGGGGASSSASNSALIDPQGFYTGTLAGVPIGSTDLKMVVLENNAIWAIYGSEASEGFTPRGFIASSASLDTTTLSSTSLIELEDLGGGAAAVGSSSGAFLSLDVSQDRLSGTIGGAFNPSNGSHQIITALLSASYPSVTAYNYNTSALISDISGSWTISGASAGTPSVAQYNLYVAANGQFTMQTGSCSFSGSISPRTSGKNVFNLSFNGQSSVNCSHSGNTSGIAISYLIPGTALRQIIIASIGADSDLFSGVR